MEKRPLKKCWKKENNGIHHVLFPQSFSKVSNKMTKMISYLKSFFFCINVFIHCYMYGKKSKYHISNAFFYVETGIH